MSEKLHAGLVTAVGIAPLCALCVLGPAALGSVVAGAFGWLGGGLALGIGALMVAAGLLIYRDLRRKRQAAGAPGGGRCGLEQAMGGKVGRMGPGSPEALGLDDRVKDHEAR